MYLSGLNIQPSKLLTSGNKFYIMTEQQKKKKGSENSSESQDKNKEDSCLNILFLSRELFHLLVKFPEAKNQITGSSVGITPMFQKSVKL